MRYGGPTLVPFPRGSPATKHSHPHRVHSVCQIDRELRNVGDDPAQTGKRNLRVDRLAILDFVGDHGKAERVIFGAPSRLGDSPQALYSAASELTDAARLEPVVPEEGKRVPQALRQSWQRWIRIRRVLMQKVDPQTDGHQSLAMKRKKRIVHRVGVLVGDAAGGPI